MRLFAYTIYVLGVPKELVERISNDFRLWGSLFPGNCSAFVFMAKNLVTQASYVVDVLIADLNEDAPRIS